MSGAIPALPNMPSWRGAQLKRSTGTTLLYITLLYFTLLSQLINYIFLNAVSN
jgi:hypothetical protein